MIFATTTLKNTVPAAPVMLTLARKKENPPHDESTSFHFILS